MKKNGMICIFLMLIASTVTAQSLYFDIGLGLGSATTKFDDNEVDFGSAVSEMGLDLSTKLGAGPLFGAPVYLVAELSAIGHRFYDATGYIQYNSYMIGPGLVFYPVSFLQIAASGGYAFNVNQSDVLVMAEGDGGFGWNVSAAFDLGKSKNGFLLGVKYAMCSTSLADSETVQKATLMSVFIKYAYRQKGSSGSSSTKR